jgi:hypothetical protein
MLSQSIRALALFAIMVSMEQSMPQWKPGHLPRPMTRLRYQTELKREIGQLLPDVELTVQTSGLIFSDELRMYANSPEHQELWGLVEKTGKRVAHRFKLTFLVHGQPRDLQ